MKIFLAGAQGQLGRELANILKAGGSELGSLPPQLAGAEIFETDIETDITSLADASRAVGEFSPDVIINCAAFTNVDKCETERDTAFKVNAIGVRNLAMAAEKAGAKLIHISTDYVFSGTGTEPYREWDMCAPASAYGLSKRMGEQFAARFCSRYFIVRTSWLYGYHGGNFVKTILKAGAARGELKVVNDQLGNPTNAADLAHHIAKLIPTEEYGIYHCTGEGICSWYNFACEIIRLGGINCTVNPCTTDEFPRPAPRPQYSALDNMMLRCTVGDEMRNWKDALKSFMDNYKGME